MRIATWNINSIRTRKARAIDFLHHADIDVVLLQETKCRDDQFPFDDFSDAGYEVFHWGLNQWNGVAIASRLGLADPEAGFPGMPGFDKNGGEPALEARAVSATVDGFRVWSVYVPNGRSLDDPHYDYKLRWLDGLGQAVQQSRADNPDLIQVVGGDFNIAPTPDDVGDPAFVEGQTTHVSPRERETLKAFQDTAGLADLVRPSVPTGYTFWDYTQGKFQKDFGMRIDFLFGDRDSAGDVVEAHIDRTQRTGEQPSDHVPVIVEFAEGDDPDDRPMVF
jgi:exodeoxyribonuclease III